MTDKAHSISATQDNRESPGILVIEDDPSNRKLIGLQLDMLGYAVDLAGTAEEGLERWRSGHYQAVLTDCKLPRMSGYDLAQAIREADKDDPAPIPIIALTGHLSKAVIERCRASGINECITKPILLDELQSVLTRWVGSAAIAEKTDDEQAR